jgi:hypothetical protein
MTMKIQSNLMERLNTSMIEMNNASVLDYFMVWMGRVLATSNPTIGFIKYVGLGYSA